MGLLFFWQASNTVLGWLDQKLSWLVSGIQYLWRLSFFWFSYFFSLYFNVSLSDFFTLVFQFTDCLFNCVYSLWFNPHNIFPILHFHIQDFCVTIFQVFLLLLFIFYFTNRCLNYLKLFPILLYYILFWGA